MYRLTLIPGLHRVLLKCHLLHPTLRPFKKSSPEAFRTPTSMLHGEMSSPDCVKFKTLVPCSDRPECSRYAPVKRKSKENNNLVIMSKPSNRSLGSGNINKMENSIFKKQEKKTSMIFIYSSLRKFMLKLSNRLLGDINRRDNKMLKEDSVATFTSELRKIVPDRSLGGSDINEKKNQIAKQQKQKKKTSLSVEKPSKVMPMLLKSAKKREMHSRKSDRALGGSDAVEVDAKKGKNSLSNDSDGKQKVKVKTNGFICHPSIWSDQPHKHSDSLKQRMSPLAARIRTGSSSHKSLPWQTKEKVEDLRFRREHYFLDRDHRVHIAQKQSVIIGARSRHYSCYMHNNGSILMTSSNPAAEKFRENYKERKSKPPSKKEQAPNEVLCTEFRKKILLECLNRRSCWQEEPVEACSDDDPTEERVIQQPITSKKISKHKKKTGRKS